MLADINTNQKEIFLRIKKKISSYNKIIILGHTNPDGDADGSVAGLGLFIKHNFYDKEVMYDTRTVLPREKIDLFCQLKKASKSDYQKSLVICCDTANQERINSWYWKHACEIIKIDHHPVSDQFGNINWVDSSFVATCEMLTLLIIFLNMSLPKNAAAALYMGIITDSNRFLYSKTTARTLAVASFLLKTDFNKNKLYSQLYRQSWSNFQRRLQIITKIKITNAGVGFLEITKSDLEKYQNKFNQIKSYVSAFNYISELKIWLIAIWNPEKNNVRVSIRSQTYKVNQVASYYGGGGHEQAAGCDIANFSALKSLVRKLEHEILKQDHE